MPGQEYVRVVNRNEGPPLKGRYDGEDYLFPRDKPVDIPMEAAEHIFGLGKEDKRQAFNMLGWLIPGVTTVEDCYKKFDRISFLQSRIVFDDEADAPALEHDAEEAEERPRGKRTGGRPHVAGPGGESAPAGQPVGAANPTA